MTGFENKRTDHLQKQRLVLMAGLVVAGQHIEAGTFDVSPGPKKCPPRAGAEVTFALLQNIETELVARGVLTRDATHSALG